MAIKISNQITFSEQKKILKIEEWYLATSYDTGVTAEDGDWGAWTKEIQTIDDNNPYLWNYEKVIYSIGDPSYDISDPIIIGVYSKSNGRGVANIINEYLLTEIPELPEQPEWSRDSSTASGLTPILKYLWNREIIIYTDGDEQSTEPAIIGVYGDSGTDAVDFQIYSTDGFEFSDNVKSIKLNTVAFKAGNKIGSNLAYQWYYFDTTENAFIASSIQSRTYSLEVNNETVGRQIYCVITDENGNSVQTETVTINMVTSLSITEQPTDVTVADGETAKTTVVAEGDGLTYQWYVRNADSTEFSKSSVTDATYSYVMNASKSGRKAY